VKISSYDDRVVTIHKETLMDDSARFIRLSVEEIQLILESEEFKMFQPFMFRRKS
jgi:hypothetical protein